MHLNHCNSNIFYLFLACTGIEQRHDCSFVDNNHCRNDKYKPWILPKNVLPTGLINFTFV